MMGATKPRVQISLDLRPKKKTIQKKGVRIQSWFLHHFYTYPEIRTQNLLIANSTLAVYATHLALEMNGTYTVYEGIVPVHSPLVSVGEVWGGVPEMCFFFFFSSS